MTLGTTLRVARPTDHFDDVLRFYSDGLGLTKLGSFENHESFDGVMLGVPGAPYHFEFTQKRGHDAGRAPTKENLLVFYLPDEQQWQTAVDRMIAAGYEPVSSYGYSFSQSMCRNLNRVTPVRLGLRTLPCGAPRNWSVETRA